MRSPSIDLELLVEAWRNAPTDRSRSKCGNNNERRANRDAEQRIRIRCTHPTIRVTCSAEENKTKANSPIIADEEEDEDEEMCPQAPRGESQRKDLLSPCCDQTTRRIRWLCSLADRAASSAPTPLSVQSTSESKKKKKKKEKEKEKRSRPVIFSIGMN